MNLRSIGIHSLGAVAIPALFVASVNAQVRSRAQSSSAAHVSAEMTRGELNPARSKPGDKVALKLKDDLKSNGEVVLKKGTTIDGVVRNVKTVEGKGQASGQALSMMEIEWLAPAAQGKATQQFSIALQSVTQMNVSSVGTAGSTVVSSAGSIASASSTRASGQSNVALLSMPSVVAVDHQTAVSLESSLGTSSSGDLFRVGHGELITAGGSKQSVDLFSHLSNDTVITSPDENFEISSGAQMQLLVGVKK